MKIYISGPMTGIEDSNYPAFNAAESKLKRMGYEVFNPASIEDNPFWKWEDYMKECVKALPKCDKVYLLRGWQTSRGAIEEVKLANTLGIPITLEGE